MSDFFYYALLVVVVVVLFNIMIVVHEAGHFLAARWRKMQIDRFQVWFGKPIWKKTVNGVQYGLGWLPFGGFVALPQMATMESVEGENLDKKSLPKVTPLDKIIVAVAGPLFSLLLAIVSALFVWWLGKPQEAIKSNLVGGVAYESPADGNLLPGDKILKVNGEPVQWFQGRLFDDILVRIMLTKGDSVDFEIERDGKVMDVTTQFTIEDTPFYKRRALPRVGIGPAGPAVVGKFIESKGDTKSPAELAGVEPGDEVIRVNGEEVFGTLHVSNLVRKAEFKESVFTIKRGEEILEKTITPLKPKGDFYKKPMLGIFWDSRAGVSSEILHPDPWTQVSNSLRTMWLTIKTISSPSSHVGLDQLSGPVGIARTKFLLLQEPNGWLRVLAFFVLFNVNLAVLNMLPLPVLDGGHIVMALFEWVRGKPIPQRFLEGIQTVFALMLIGFMLFITTKDIGDEIPAGERGDSEIEWPSPSP